MVTRKLRKTNEKKKRHIPSVAEKRALEFVTAIQVELFKALKNYQDVFELEAKFERGRDKFELKVANDCIHPDYAIVEKVQVSIGEDGKINRRVVSRHEVPGDHEAFCEVYDPIKLCSE